jgi:hypothetical protein
MIKLLKYDWKRNSVTLIMAFVIIVLIQAVFTGAGKANGWDPNGVYAGMVVFYGMAAFLTFLLAFQTYHSNIKSYSRRLLPVPSVYLAVTPFLLLLACHAAVGILFIAHDMLFRSLFGWGRSLIDLMAEHVGAAQAAGIAATYVWNAAVTSAVVMFSITMSRTVEGKGGTWLGLLTAIILFTAVPWLEGVIFPVLSETHAQIGFITFFANAPGSTEFELVPFKPIHFGVVLFEAAVVAALVWGIAYLLDRKTKL